MELRGFQLNRLKSIFTLSSSVVLSEEANRLSLRAISGLKYRIMLPKTDLAEAGSVGQISFANQLNWLGTRTRRLGLDCTIKNMSKWS